MDIKNKTIWLTGASSGIGEALAKELDAQGASLVLIARRHDTLESLRNTLNHADKHHVLTLDIADYHAVPSAVSRALASLPPPDILINNAGVSHRGTALDTQLGVYESIMAINYFGVVALTQALLPTLREKQGKVVTVSSVAGKVGGHGMSAYAAAKHAVIGYLDCLRAEESEFSVSVLTVCPGFVQTNISKNALTADGKPFGEMADSIATGVTAAHCASRITQAIEADAKEVYIGKGLSRWAPTIKRLFPSLFMKLAAKKNIR